MVHLLLRLSSSILVSFLLTIMVLQHHFHRPTKEEAKMLQKAQENRLKELKKQEKELKKREELKMKNRIKSMKNLKVLYIFAIVSVIIIVCYDEAYLLQIKLYLQIEHQL